MRTTKKVTEGKRVVSQNVRLGVNIDHVATLRNARGGSFPDPICAAHLAIAAGADGITAHLREDRRHIRDEDVWRLRREISVPLNLEIAATREMCAFACHLRPHAVCLVPERREERTTEGGLQLEGQGWFFEGIISELKEAGIRVSLFLEPELKQIEMAASLGADAVELHTGRYCKAAEGREIKEEIQELARLRAAAAEGAAQGIEMHAGHGLNFETVERIVAIPQIVEVNIGHFLMGEALFTGLEHAIQTMRKRLEEGRHLAQSKKSGKAA